MRAPLPKFIGARVRRREDPDLLTGRGLYVADIPMQGAAHMALLRSPYAHARIRGIDVRQALSLPGVIAVATAADLMPSLEKPLPVLSGTAVGEYQMLANPPNYPLRQERVTCVGDPVAAVLAEDPYTALDALDAIQVDYEPLPALASLDEAQADGAPLVHESAPGNRGFQWRHSSGQAEEALAQAEVVVELKVRIQRLLPTAMEPRTVLASHDPDSGRLTVWSSTQVPHMLRGDLSDMLGIPSRQIRVVAPEVGGGFGAKVNAYGEDVLAAWMARRYGRPVRWTASRSEDYLTTSHGRAQQAVLRLAADREGRLSAADVEVTADCGALYTRLTPIVAPLTCQMINGCYHIPNLRGRAVGIFTNKLGTEPYRGSGRPEACLLIERAMDMLAAKLKMDPVEVRRRNFIPPDQFPYKTGLGMEYDSGEYEKALDKALQLAGYAELRQEQARRRQEGGKLMGIGLACYVEICGFGPFEMGTVDVQADGKVVVLTGTSPHGQGHQTSWAQIAAETLQIPMEDILVRHGDTDVVRQGVGTFGSRSAAVGGSAIVQSAETVRQGAQEIAAHLLEAAPPDIRLEEGAFHVAGVPSPSLSWKQVAAAAHSPDLPEELQGKLQAETRFKPSGETYPFGTHLCVVEVDPETGEIRLLRYLSVDDCGRVINPLIVEGQVHGGIAQGIGQALLEAAAYDDQANLLSGTLMDYALPRADDFPEFETHRTVTPTPLNVLGVKGIGEAATIGSTPAVVNAVVDALAHLGVEHIDTPITAEKIWRILQSR
ncbi:MAG: xanthine dehydrogenase family protein molybdopterin-binding subunit [Acidobacteriota bacterium]